MISILTSTDKLMDINVTGPAKAGHVGTENLTTFSNFHTVNQEKFIVENFCLFKFRLNKFSLIAGIIDETFLSKYLKYLYLYVYL